MGNSLLTLCPTDFGVEDAFEDTYEVDEVNYIGTGKFSVVHLCWRRNQPEKRYALKVINTRAGDVASENRIKEEIHILQLLGNHPCIVTLIDVDETQLNCIRIVMELCEGGELYDRIQQKQFYPEQEAKACVRNLLDAASYIHSRGIMHRDLKPENILLASKVSNTEIKISDFGLAKISKDFPRRLPRSHSICGSDFYLAPEVIKQEEYGREIDIWAIGVITYVLLSGSLPFFHQVLHKLYRQIVERDLSFPEQAWKNVSKGALDFILRILQVRPGDRLTADQCLGHPWLRNASSSSSSFGSSFQEIAGNITRAISMTATPSNNPPRSGSDDLPRSLSSNAPYPLEHAKKVNSQGSGQPAQTGPIAVPKGQPSRMASTAYGAAAPAYGRPAGVAGGAVVSPGYYPVQAQQMPGQVRYR